MAYVLVEAYGYVAMYSVDGITLRCLPSLKDEDGRGREDDHV